MESNEDERPTEAIAAAAALDDDADKTIVGIGEYVAHYGEPPEADEDGVETIVVCRVVGVDECETSNRTTLHGEIVFEIEAGAPELKLEREQQPREAPA